MRLIWDETVSKFVEPHRVAPKQRGKRGDFPMPYAAGDIKPYMSPLGTGEITSRSQRREELKRSGCREVDPSERMNDGHDGYFNEKYARRYSKKARAKRRNS